MSYMNYPTHATSGAGLPASPYGAGGHMPWAAPGYGAPAGMYPSSAAPVPGAPTYAESTPSTGVDVPGHLPAEQSYIENILRLNLGKRATIYMTYENNSQWNAKIFKGILEAAGRDHIIISDPDTGMRFLLLMVNLDYITFDEVLNYDYPY